MPTFSDASMANFAMSTPGAGGAFGGGSAFGNPAFLSQPPPNFMMNPMAMMNPQFLAMQMQQMQTQMPGMNMAGAMYNTNAMFNAYGGMESSNQLPTDPFNASFNAAAAAFPSQPLFNPLTGTFDAMGGMAPPQAMLNPMSAFPMMPDPMMMNAFGYGMGDMQPPLPQTSQQQPPPPSEQQPSDFPESSLFDDAMASNLFDGFPEDTFL